MPENTSQQKVASNLVLKKSTSIFFVKNTSFNNTEVDFCVICVNIDTQQQNWNLIMKLQINHILIVLASLVLTACGGGSEDGEIDVTNSSGTTSSNGPVTLSLDTKSTELSMGESSKINFDIDVSYTGNESLEMSSNFDLDGATLTGSYKDSAFVMSIASEDVSGIRMVDTTFTVTIADGNIQRDKTFTLSLENSSFDESLLYAQEALDAISSTRFETEMESIVHFTAQNAYLNGLMSNEEKEAWSARVQDLTTDLDSKLNSESITELNDLLSTEGLTESELLDSTNRIVANFLEEKDLLSKITESLKESGVHLFSDMPEVRISKLDKNYSLFYGNKNLGKEVDQEWVFNDKWSHLAKLLPVNDTPCRTANISSNATSSK